MPRKKLEYVSGEGKRYPLHEATYDFPITVYKSDCRKAEIGNPEQCLIALGARRNKRVEGAWIGSGKDAYVAFKAVRGRAAHVLHFTLNAKAARIRDFFETKKGATTQQIILSAVTAGRTRLHRAKLGKLRAKKIKAGKHVVKPRGKINATRIMRLGVAHRPTPNIENNVVSVGPRPEKEVA
jgi:hypothetical protein